MRRSIQIDAAGALLVTNDAGDFAILSPDDADGFRNGARLPADRAHDLEARDLGAAESPRSVLADAVRRTRKSFLSEGPALHIFVVTLRCDHTCAYCQVSRANVDAFAYDMSESTAFMALDRVFESDAAALTVEFQGGEPLLRADLVRRLIEVGAERAESDGRRVRFTIATTLQLASAEDLAFFAHHGVHVSTSIDGARLLHDAHRQGPAASDWDATVAALERARAVLGRDGVAALPTITRKALADPRALIDAYLDLGFRSVFLRPVMTYGFARKAAPQLEVSTAEFQAFYETALDYILDLNAQGIELVETNAAIALRHILTPYHSGYVDLRSPAGAGLGVVVYNHDGLVYPSDEARMAARVGDARFALGRVETPLASLLTAPVMQWLAKGAIAERLPDCGACAFVPYCGADPVFHAIAQGEPDAPRHGTQFCDRQMTIFRAVFRRIATSHPEINRTFLAWAFETPRAEVRSTWIPT